MDAHKRTGWMRRARAGGRTPIALAVLVLALLTGCAAPASDGSLSLTVVHSNDTWGYLDPCG